MTLAGITDPVDAKDAANKGYVDSVVGGAPGAPLNSVQFNSAGVLGGIADWTTDGSSTLAAADAAKLTFGGSAELSLDHDGVDSNVISTAGDLVIDNQSMTGDTKFVLGTDDSKTGFVVANDSGVSRFQVLGNGAVSSSQFQVAGSDDWSADPGVDGVSRVRTEAKTTTDTGTAASGTLALAATVELRQQTYAATNASVTTTNAATLYVEDAPAAGTNNTITNAWSIYAPSGDVKVGGDVFASSFNASSDATLKTHVSPLHGALDRVRRIGTYSYAWKKDRDCEDGGKRHIGVLAQQLESVGLGSLVSDKGPHKSVNYLELIPMLIESVKELATQNDLLRASLLS